MAQQPRLPQLVAPLRRFLTREDGPTAVEYAVMLALIVVVCITSVMALGQSATKSFQSVDTGGQPVGTALKGGSNVSDGVWEASAPNGGNGTQKDTYNAKTGEWSYSYSGGSSTASGTFSSPPGKLPDNQMGIGSSQTWTRVK